MIQPEKKPEELVFELYSPPSAAAPTPMTPIEYKPEELDLPPIEEIEIPEPPELVDESDPEPEELIPVEPERKTMSIEEFRKSNPIIEQRIPKQTPRTQRKVDLSPDLEKLRERLSNVNVELQSTTLDSMSASDQSKLESYFAQLRQAILNSVEIHPFVGVALKTRVEFSLAPTGRLTGARVTTSSGDPEYDRKVVDAIKRLSQFTKPPGFTSTETLTFTVMQRDR